ncbi:hypothetical protein M422DRAFT_248707 [Sphaerobolus stellatus SS14]|nr:hypothetical protein M422DRAFT_248707 [Sphaerobolus stellatus SS14]
MVGVVGFTPSFLADVEAKVEAEVEGRDEHIEDRCVEKPERSPKALVRGLVGLGELRVTFGEGLAAERLQEREVCFVEADVEEVVDIKVLMFMGVGRDVLGVGAEVSQVVQHVNVNARMEEGVSVVGIVAVAAAANPAIAAFAFAATPMSMSSALFFPAPFSARALPLLTPTYSCIAVIGDDTNDELGRRNGEWLAT